MRLFRARWTFYFGAERLRRIAQRLASVQDDGTFHPVQMLAANLVQRTSYWKDTPKLLDVEKNLKFTPGLPEGFQAVEITDRSTVLPFLQTVTLRVPEKVDPKPYLCRANPEDDLDRKLPCGSNRIELKPVLCDAAKNLTVCPAGNRKESRVYSLGTLDPEANYGLCMPPDGDEILPHCVRFSVARPYLLAPLSPSCKGTTEACRGWEKPYYFKRLSDGTQVVVFGVVDPDLPSLVGRDNLSWKNADSRLQTQVSAMDPVKALQEAMQYFEVQEKDNIDAAKLRKVLLVQMSKDKAEELASHLDFDLVIAEAGKRGRATGNSMLTLDPDRGEDPQGRPYRPVVVVPERGLNASRTLINPIRELRLQDYSPSAPGGERRELAVKTRWDPISNGEQPKSYKRDLDDMASDWLPVAVAPNEDPFIMATLKIMRDTTGADVSTMQKRDFYFGQLRPSSYLGEVIAGVLWKGDILQVITVTGDTLRKVLRESKQFDQADIQPIKVSEESGRGLIVYGIKSTEDGNYLINGNLLEKSRLYTIATTNHISVGDTGYAELNDPALADKSLPHSHRAAASRAERELENLQHGEGKEISELVCKELKQSGCVSDVTDALFASSSQRAPEIRADLWPRTMAWLSTSMERPLLSKGEQRLGYPTLQDSAESAATWRLSLKELSWSFGAVRNNLSEVQRVSQLTGASDPAAYAAKGHSIDYATRAEWVRGTASIDEFLRGQLLYKSNSTGSTKTVGSTNQIVPGLANVSQPKDQVLLDSGFFWHGLGRNKYYPQQGIVIEPFHFDTQLVQNSLPINSHYNNATGVLDRPAYRVPLERTRMFLGRVGYRLQNQGNSFEVGYEGGWETNALDKLTFLVGGNAAECDLKAQQTLNNCLTNQPISIQSNAIHQIRSTRPRNGFYATMDWTLPLFWRMSFVAFGQGEYFREAANDNSSDTLYRNLASGTVRIAIWPNFSIAPGLERLDYENKLTHTHLATWSPVFKLVYSFDQYSGGRWGKATRFRPGN